jgi:hypothetical protein
MEKNKDIPNKTCRLNIYWSQTAGAVRMYSWPGQPDIVRFSFKGKSWNARMSAAYMCTVLAASWLTWFYHSLMVDVHMAD